MSEAFPIAARWAAVQERIARAAQCAGRAPEEIRVVAVSKRKSTAQILAALQIGLVDFGENYVQEASAKIPQVAAALRAQGAPLPRWHFIGQLQRNKAHEVATLFGCVHSVDRAELARELARRAGAAGHRLDVFLQINLSGEHQKAGAAPQELPALLEVCSSLASLHVLGLMTLPAASLHPEDSRPVFAELRKLRDTYASADCPLRELSMGMSVDFEVAIEEGATCVRIGTALFGAREEQHAD